MHGVPVGSVLFMKTSKLDWEYVWGTFIPRTIILLSIGAVLAAITSCREITPTVAPQPIVNTAPSLDVHGKPTSGLLEFHSDYIVVDSHWMDRYHAMVALNNQKPDLVNGAVNPDKVFIAGKEDLGTIARPDGNYRVTYITLMYFDRLNQKLKSNRR